MFAYARIVRLQMQMQRSPKAREFSGPIDVARKIYLARGIPGLWSGFTGSMLFRLNFFWLFSSFEVCRFMAMSLHSADQILRLLCVDSRGSMGLH